VVFEAPPKVEDELVAASSVGDPSNVIREVKTCKLGIMDDAKKLADSGAQELAAAHVVAEDGDDNASPIPGLARTLPPPPLQSPPATTQHEDGTAIGQSTPSGTRSNLKGTRGTPIPSRISFGPDQVKEFDENEVISPPPPELEEPLPNVLLGKLPSLAPFGKLKALTQEPVATPPNPNLEPTKTTRPNNSLLPTEGPVVGQEEGVVVEATPSNKTNLEKAGAHPEKSARRSQEFIDMFDSNGNPSDSEISEEGGDFPEDDDLLDTDDDNSELFDDDDDDF